jgi:hypothetical protein
MYLQSLEEPSVEEFIPWTAEEAEGTAQPSTCTHRGMHVSTAGRSLTGPRNSDSLQVGVCEIHDGLA